MLYLSIVCILFVTGCESNIGLDFPAHAPELAVFCVFNPDEAWTVIVRNTASLADSISNASWFIANARVEILHEGNVVATPVHTEKGIYIAEDNYPKKDINYTLRVSAPGYPIATATNRVPDFIGTPDVIFADSVGFEAETRSILSEMHLTFRDPGEQTNFYAIDAWVDYGGGIRQTWYTSSDPVLTSTPFVNIFGKENNQATVFDDATFNGSTFEAVISVDRNYADQYRADLLHVSEAYYRYALSLVQIEAAGDNPFAEPTRPYSNMEQGQGVFAGYLRHKTAPIELNEIDINVIAGKYKAFVFFGGNNSLDLMGIPQDTLRFELSPDGRTRGDLFIDKIHNFDNPSQDLNIALEGTFSYEKPYIKMTLTPATFLNDAQWVYDLNGFRPVDTEAMFFAFFNKIQER